MYLLLAIIICMYILGMINDTATSPLSPLIDPKLSSGVRPALCIGLPQFSHSGSLEHDDWLGLEIESIKLATGKQPALTNYRYSSLCQ